MEWFIIVLSPIGFIFNLVALIAVAKAKFSLKAYQRFLISLLSSNLAICLVNILMQIQQEASEKTNSNDDSNNNNSTEEIVKSKQKCWAEIGRSLEIVALVGHLLNLCAMSVDHFIGIVYPLQYLEISNRPLHRYSVFFIWIVSFLIGFCDYPFLLIGSNGNYKNENLQTFESFQIFLNAFDKNCSLQRRKRASDFEDFSEADFRKFDLTQMFDSIFSNDSINQTGNDCQNNDLTSMTEESSWCERFDGSSKVWLEIGVMLLAIASLIFLAFCFGMAIRQTQLSDALVNRRHSLGSQQQPNHKLNNQQHNPNNQHIYNHALLFRNKSGYQNNNANQRRHGHKMRKMVLTTLILVGSFVIW